VTRGAPSLALPGVLAAVALIAAAGIILFVPGRPHAGYQLILSVPLVPLTVASSANPPQREHPYQLADYPDALAAFRQGVVAALAGPGRCEVPLPP